MRPGVSLVYAGPNLKFSATYSAEILYRSLTSDTELNHQYSGGTIGSLELVPQLLFLDTTSNVSQQNVSAFGAQPLNNINTTRNRTTVRTTVLSPYARYSFGGDANAEVRYTYSIVDSSEAIGRGVDSTADRFDASLASGAAYGATSWRLDYNWETIHYDLGRDTTFERIQASARRLLTPVFALVGTLGYEDNNYLTTEAASPSGSIWTLGFNWTPTPRTNLYAAAGHRFYGKTYAFDFNHRTRLTVWNANYSEEVTSTRQQILAPTQANTASLLDTLFLARFPDPVARQQAVQQEIARLGLPGTLIVPVNVFTNQVYIQKAWRATVGLQGVFHTVFANVYALRRDAQTPLVAAATADFAGELRQTGSSLSWSYRITPYTAGSATLGYSRSETATIGLEDRNKYARLALNHVIGPRTSGSIYYQRQHQNSNGPADYTENQVAAALEVRF